MKLGLSVTVTLVAIMIFCLNMSAAQAAEVTVYKSPYCGCCTDWVKHLEKNGFEVETIKSENMGDIKASHGVTPNLASCHTAVIDGYVFEGHVPADVIRKFLKEKPKVRGLAVPGMPIGSPGMEGETKEHYDVLTFDKQGKTTVYTSR